LDPTYVIGGVLNSAGTNAHLGSGEYVVAEADESDASFLYLHPMISVITNIDADHMETYQGDFTKLEDTFINFIHNLPFYGLCVLCVDDPVIRKLLPRIARPVITYGESDDADIRAINITQQGLKTSCQVLWRDGRQPAFTLSLNLPGTHNILNALATIAVATELAVNQDKMITALNQFSGVGRRFQIHGQFPYDGGDIILVDDYGHHPNEILATIKAARGAFPERRLFMVYQPHRYSRTRDLFVDFVKVLSLVDELVLLDIYSAGEDPIPGVNGHNLYQAIKNHSRVNITFVEKNQLIEETLAQLLKGNELLLLQGAGDIGGMAQRLSDSQLRFSGI
jgi:UDP-N-acetylmuramate--alanine ligase